MNPRLHRCKSKRHAVSAIEYGEGESDSNSVIKIILLLAIRRESNIDMKRDYDWF